MAGTHADARPRADARQPLGGTFWRNCRRVSRLVDGTRGYRAACRLCAIARNGQVARTGTERGRARDRCWGSPGFDRRCRVPARLKQIYDPPIVLYVRGAVDILAQPGIAVVGTRHPTPYGSGMAERVAIDLAARGLVMQSGMARGVDPAAHRGAINAKGKTIAVFGTGVDYHIPRKTRASPSKLSRWEARSSPNSRWEPSLLRRIFRSAIASSAACRWEC